MDAILQCYRCGESLAALSLPLSRQDVCPGCGRYLHCCKLCVHYDPQVPEQCREDDAEEVTDKEQANFCDWFEPQPGRYDAGAGGAAARSEAQLEALFGEEKPAADGDDPLKDAAEDLFR